MSGRERKKNRNKQIKKKKQTCICGRSVILCAGWLKAKTEGEKKKKVKDVAIKQQVNSLNREGDSLSNLHTLACSRRTECK